MTEFNDIFAYALPTSVYIYGSLGFIGAFALIALRVSRQAPAVAPRWAGRLTFDQSQLSDAALQAWPRFAPCG